MALALPIFDTTLVSVARYFSGRAISQGGRDHASHRLVAIGLSETTAVLTLWTISAAAGVIAYLLYSVGFAYAMFAVAILVLGLALFGAVLSRVRVYPEGTEPDGPASAWGFTLPGELLYKRQMLWVILDGITVVLALTVAFELARDSSAPPELSAAVACVVIGLFALGLYRWDWAHFGLTVAARIVAGAGAGLVATAVLQRVIAVGEPFSALMLAAAWLMVSVGVCGTRIAVRVIDQWLHRLGGARG